jgi:hypothetical protein
MLKQVLILSALTAFWAVPASAAHDSANDSKSHASPCKSQRAEDRAQPQAAKTSPAPPPSAEAPSGNFLSHGWLSFFGRPSSPLLP